jgi:hypothetical protein
MSNVINRSDAALAAEPDQAGPTGADAAHNPADAPRRWSRARTIWLLIGLSLLPGFVAAVDRQWWAGLPPGLRLTAYAISGVLIVVACALIVLPERARDAGRADRPRMGESS